MDNSKLPSLNELSETLITTLRSIFSNNLPDAVRTQLDGFLTSPNEPDLLVNNGSPQDLAPLFYSQNPDENYPNTISRYVNFLTASSDPNVVAADDQTVKIVWGRNGSDNLFSYDPSVEQRNRQKIHVLIGDFTDEQLSRASTSSVTQWKDRFILGDWHQPFYVENEPSTLGLNQFALMTDFNPNQDIIQLHGTSQDYQLVDTSLGTAIFWQNGNSFDLVALVAGVPSSSLSLEGDEFEFKGNTPPDKAFPGQAQQIGTTGIDFSFSSSVDAKGNLYIGGGTGGSLSGANSGSRDVWLAKYDRNGDQQWIRQFGTTEYDNLWSMASDGSNTYVAGNTSGNLGSSSKGGRDVYLAKYDDEGNQQWIRQFGTLTGDESFTMAADTSGNVYVAGHTVGDLAAPNRSTEVGGSAFPSTDVFISKFDSQGNQLWTQQFGTPLLDDNWGVSVDEAGNVFAGGNTRGNLEGKNAGFYDVWLTKLNKEDGSQQWVKQFGTSSYDFLWDIDTDSKGNTYAIGSTEGALGGENAGSYDTWVVKYDSNGNQQWIKQFGTSGDDSPYFHGIEVDSNDDILLTGNTNGSLAGANTGSYDTWVMKYNGKGNRLWSQQFGTSDYDTPTSISSDSHGSVYVSGITEGSWGDRNAGSYDSWLVKLDSSQGTIQDFSGSTSSLF